MVGFGGPNMVSARNFWISVRTLSLPFDLWTASIPPAT
jgi:hypothetical protein